MVSGPAVIVNPDQLLGKSDILIVGPFKPDAGSEQVLPIFSGIGHPAFDLYQIFFHVIGHQ